MRAQPCKGPILATLIVLGWALTLLALLTPPINELSLPLVVLAVLGRTFLQTGLFIIGHDAMHGVLLPRNRRLNDRLGALVLGLYAALPYRLCRRNHQLHHQATASWADPDFHPDPEASVVAWYIRFMAGYLNARQMTRLLGGWSAMAAMACFLSPTGWMNVLLFCTLPLLLSSMQLFTFGTYLPHRKQRSSDGPRPVASLEWPVWLSLLTCYHFGYHRQHHETPQLAWFELPRCGGGAKLSPASSWLLPFSGKRIGDRPS